MSTSILRKRFDSGKTCQSFVSIFFASVSSVFATILLTSNTKMEKCQIKQSKKNLPFNGFSVNEQIQCSRDIFHLESMELLSNILLCIWLINMFFLLFFWCSLNGQTNIEIHLRNLGIVDWWIRLDSWNSLQRFASCLLSKFTNHFDWLFFFFFWNFNRFSQFTVEIPSNTQKFDELFLLYHIKIFGIAWFWH